MKYLHRLTFAAASAAFFIASSAVAGNPGTVSNHAFVLGKGAGMQGYTSLLCGSAQLAVGQNAADPICQTVTGEGSLSSAGVFALSRSFSPTMTGNWIFDPASGDALTVNPAANSYAKGFNITQSSPTSGSVAGPLFYNDININHQADVTGVSQAAGWHLKMNSGGANMAGAGPQMGLYVEMLDGIAGSTGVSDKIGIAGSCFTIIADSAGGGCYGSNNYAGVSGTGSINRLVGHESDIEIRSGGSAAYRYAFSAVNENLGVGQASTLDAGYIVGNIGSASGAFKNAFVLSNSLGAAPLSTTGNVFTSDAPQTVANVLQFPNMTVTGNIWNFPNTSMDGSGQMTAQDVKVTGGPATITTGQGTIGASANSGLILQGFGASFDVQLLNKTGGTACVVPTGTTTLNCNTVAFTNPVPVASGGTGKASYTIGDIIFASGATTLASLTDVATGNVLLSGGVGVAPSYGKVGLTTHVTGTLPIANGGTGDTGTGWTDFSGTIAPSCGTATFTVNSAKYKTLGKTVFMHVDISIASLGTCTHPVTFTAPVSAVSQQNALAGNETANTSLPENCFFMATGSTITCFRGQNTSYGAGDRIVASGTFESQ